ncbi:MAG: AMP-binding protein [Thermodesulfobacteriota bacterium]
MMAPASVFIPPERRVRNPLITEAGYLMFDRIRQHPAAPRWNYVVGDRIEAEDLPLIQVYREAVFAGRPPGAGGPPPQITAWVRGLRDRVRIFQERLPEGYNLERDWAYIETMRREDVAVRTGDLVPMDADLSRLIVYDTSGTTGHAIAVPSHPLAQARTHPLLEYVLGRYGLEPVFGPEMVACICVSARSKTVIFPNVFSVWNQAGFAKVNLHPQDWADVEKARRFFQDLAPWFLTGDPVGFAEMMKWDIPVRPAALVSTAVTLSPGLKSRLEERYGCPAIDWYSSTETGPVAYACPRGLGLHLLPPDIYVEVLDEEGFPVPEGERGEIAVTGGRNPYLPLLRYRTGDWGRLDFSPCPCGDQSPRLLDLDGRSPVFFRAVDGSVVNPVDIGRLLRGEFVFVQHEFIQRADGSCELNLRPAAGCPLSEKRILEILRGLFGPDLEIRVNLDETLGDRTASGKVVPYRSELAV